MKKILFRIDAISESQNPWDRMHWSTRQRNKDFWYWLIKARLGVREPLKERRLVHITRVSKRLIDDANVPSGCKYIVDALQQFGYIYNDSRRWTRVTFDQRKCRKNEPPHMEIAISTLKQQEEPQEA